jgi:hypothetical protein
MTKDHLEGPSYRLPREAEMENAIRAGAVTSRFFGESEDLLAGYAWYKANSNWVLLGGWFFMLGCIAFLWFAVLLRERFEDAAAPRTATRLGFAGAIAAVALGIAIPLLDIAAAINKDDISAATAGAAHHFSDGFFVGAEIALIPVFLAGAVAALSSRVLPKWWAWLMILVAIVLVIGPIGWAALIFGTPIWVLGTTWMLLRRRPAARTEIAPTAV